MPSFLTWLHHDEAPRHRSMLPRAPYGAMGPVLPLCREVTRDEELKTNLVLYRKKFGQPRQEDLLAYLTGMMGLAEVLAVAERFRLTFGPAVTWG